MARNFKQQPDLYLQFAALVAIADNDHCYQCFKSKSIWSSFL